MNILLYVLTQVKERAGWLSWGGVTFFLVWQNHDLLVDAPLAGWDLLPHYHVLAEMIKNLQRGEVVGYDPLWNAGYPSFMFYGPLFYGVAALPHLVAPTWISPYLAMNAMLFLFPFVFLLCFHWAATSCTPKLSWTVTLLVGIFFLCVGKPWSHAGLGIAGLIYNGLVTHMAALLLYLVWLGSIMRVSGLRPLTLIGLGMIWAGLILTHAMTTLAAVFTLGIFLLIHPRKLLIHGGSLAIGLLLSAWYWIPFIRHGWLSSGRKMLFSEWHLDPLFYLYPRLTLDGLKQVFITPFPAILVEIPLPALILLGCGAWGGWRLIQTNRPFLPVAWIAALLVLPRGFLFAMLDAPIHYYRFIPVIFLLNAVLAAHGLSSLWAGLPMVFPRHTMLARSVVACVYIWAAATAMIREYDLERPYQQAAPFAIQQPILDFSYSKHLHDYPDYNDAVEVLNFFGNLNQPHRVVVEVTQYDMTRLGSPHFFTSFLPMSSRTPVVPGLLAESSLTHGFVQAAMFNNSSMLIWNHSDLIEMRDFLEQPMELMVERLRLFSIRYLVASTELFSNHLDQLEAHYTPPPIRQVFRQGRFAVYEIMDTYPQAEGIVVAPFLFIDAGGMTFVEFSEAWYRHPGLFPYPVLFTPHAYPNLPAQDRAQVAGLILGFAPGQRIRADDVKPWWLTGKQILTVGGIPDLEVLTLPEVIHIPSFPSWTGLNQLADVFQQRAPNPLKGKEVTIRLEGRNLVVTPQTGQDAVGTLIRYSYAPVLTESEGRTIYMATPSISFIFNQKSP